MSNRIKIIGIRLTLREYAILKQLAYIAHKSLSQYIRDLIFREEENYDR